MPLHRPRALKLASVIIIDVNLDINLEKKPLGVDLKKFSLAIKTVGKYMQPKTLVIVQTTVPPGTTEKCVYQFFKK